MKLLDCTIRDGGYINNWNFTDIYVNKLISCLENCNYDYIELGYTCNDDKYNSDNTGKWRSIDINNININNKSIKFTLMCDNKKYKSLYLSHVLLTLVHLHLYVQQFC